MGYNSDYGSYRTRSFAEIYPAVDDFVTAYKASALYNSELIDSNLEALYYLLYGAYGNSHISNSDETQFRYKVYGTIYMYGPAWQRRLTVQETLRGMNEADLMLGARQVMNTALNPATAPSTSNIDELTTIDSQTASNNVRSKLDAYAVLMQLLETDVTKEFIDKFKYLFLTIVAPQEPLWYETTIGD